MRSEARGREERVAYVFSRSSILDPRSLVVFVIVLALVGPASAGELQWQRGRTPKSQSVRSAMRIFSGIAIAVYGRPPSRTKVTADRGLRTVTKAGPPFAASS